MPEQEDLKSREECYRCRKAKVMCYCAQIKPFASDPEFVILIHPKETRKAINTGRMAFLNLQNAKLLVGNDFSGDPSLSRLLNDPSKRCYLLFPGPAAIDIHDLPCSPSDRAGKAGLSDVFIILDATWSMAKKMFRLSQNLQKIPQVMFKPEKASEFLIRQQPGFDCYSTIETIHHMIELRANGHDAAAPHHHLLHIFRDMVQKQIDYENGAFSTESPALSQNRLSPSH
ncbi:MAG: DTW domain-containing protein [Oligoflexus sp.]|nr:DTW domain-containing protein [Oligoflexus sp.]